MYATDPWQGSYLPSSPMVENKHLDGSGLIAGVKAHPIFSPTFPKNPDIHSQDGLSSVLSELPWLPSHSLHLQPAERGSLAQGMPRSQC